MDNKIHISIVFPVYHGEKMVAELVRRNVECKHKANSCLEYDEE